MRHVFGVPGGQRLALYDGILDQPGLDHVLTRDERSAAYAADGYARVTGQVGVCDATVGPGAAKLPSGLSESLAASVPVVALVSDLPARLAPHRYRGAASQALDQAGLTAAWRAARDAERASGQRPIAPQRVLADLEAALGPDDVLICDASLASGWGGVYLEQRRPGRRVLSPRGQAGLGLW